MATCQECAHAHKRESYREMRADPQRWAARLADQRMNYRLRREREGKSVRPPLSQAEYFKRYGNGAGGNGHNNGHVLPAGPLRTLLNQWPEALDIEALARRSGVSSRRIRSVMHAHQDQVSLRLADCVCVALGTTLFYVYGETA